MIYLLFAVVIFGAGQLIRKCIESKKELLKRETLIKDKIDIIHMHNKGALLSTFEDKPKLVSSAMLVAIGMLLSIFGQSLMEKNGKIKKFGLSIMLGGAISNAYERLSKGYVVDYVNLPNSKKLKNAVFNLADMFVVLGAIITVIGSFFKKND